MTRKASSVSARSLAILFSFRKFEYSDQINWLTIARPDAYHLYIEIFKRGDRHDHQQNGKRVRYR
ncbi:hypothetical protein D6C13_04470 [Rahnella woolbedingensis]|uniref:Uncharacterized protein n=1 Tax=Rahnella woolbedingensis TaxID=1510574 RepID=A0A419NDE4_9GAMM|nr:hypothetical protein D6C13_04470 [Rahnella woolbedingensis]